jgi:hypothetical protein
MAVRWDAAGDRCTWTGTAPTPSSGLTITFWCYVSVDTNDFATMIRLHASSGATTNLNVAMDSSGTLPCVFTAGGSSTGPQSLTVGSWARIAVTVTGTTSTVYVGLGAGGATQSAAGTVGANAGVSPTSGYTVGGRSIVDGSEWFNGRLAHLRIWSTVLTQTEIEAEWASATPVRTSLLFAAYPLPDATDLLDSSGNTRHLAAGGTAVTTEDGPPLTTTITGTLAASLPPVAASVTGAVASTGTLAADLPALTSSTTGDLTTGGQLATSLPAISATVAGGVSFDATMAMELPAAGAAVAGRVDVAGQLVGSLPPVDTELAGDAFAAGSVDAGLPALDAALSGSVAVPVTGTLVMVLPALTMASGRTAWPPAVADAPLGSLVGVAGPEDVPWLGVT